MFIVTLYFWNTAENSSNKCHAIDLVGNTNWEYYGGKLRRCRCNPATLQGSKMYMFCLPLQAWEISEQIVLIFRHGPKFFFPKISLYLVHFARTLRTSLPEESVIFPRNLRPGGAFILIELAFLKSFLPAAAVFIDPFERAPPLR